MLITIGTVIGSGIYLVPGVVLRQTGGQTGTALLVWTVGGVLSLLGALTYAELGAMNPEAGGLYVYIRDAFGPLPSFLYGWTSFFVISSGSLATLAVAFSGYLGPFVPFGRGGALVVSVLLIGVLAVVNIRGTRTSATMQNWTTGLKIGALTLLGGSLIAFGHGASSATTMLPGTIAPASAAGFGAAGTILGPVAGRLVGALILVSIFSASNGLVLTRPRMYFAMARDRVFFERLALVHARFGTPAFAILAIALWAALLAATGTFEQLLTYVIFAGWIFYAFGALSVFVYRRRQPNLPRPFRVPGYPVTPLLFVLSAVLLVLNTVLTQPGRAAVGLGAVLLGTPAFYLWRAHSRRRPVPPAQESHDAPTT